MTATPDATNAAAVDRRADDFSAGRVAALHVKPSVPGEPGLPKPAVPSVRIEYAGVVGDYNRYRTDELDGDPDSAVLLLPAETIEALGRDGWPVRPGDLGENVTTRGVAYDDLAPGAQWAIGTAVVETTRACTPCGSLAVLPYVGAEKLRTFQAALLGRRGWYARVVVPGDARVGDPVVRVRPPAVAGATRAPVGPPRPFEATRSSLRSSPP